MTTIFARIEQGIVTDADAAWADVSTFFTNDVQPFLQTTLALLERNGGALLLTEAETLLNSVGEIAAGQWGTVVAQLLANAKAAGATTLASEETLAASTALQIAQNAAAASPAPATATTATATLNTSGANGTD